MLFEGRIETTVPEAKRRGLPLLCAAFAIRERGGMAPVLWADVDIVPERSEWDAVRVG
jgi:hypothetical protein